MKINGKAIAEKIYADLILRVADLKQKSITPSLAVILIGDDPGSVSYVAQKEKFAERLGVDLQIERMGTGISQEELEKKIHLFAEDHSIHGIMCSGRHLSRSQKIF